MSLVPRKCSVNVTPKNDDEGARNNDWVSNEKY